MLVKGITGVVTGLFQENFVINRYVIHHVSSTYTSPVNQDKLNVLKLMQMLIYYLKIIQNIKG